MLTLEEDFIITITDCRRAGHCPRGIKRWFDGHGIDFRDFLKNGCPASVILSTSDAQGDRVVRKAIERRAHE